MRTDIHSYLDKTVALVRGWRREWGQGDFPYFLVQLAPLKYDSRKGTTLALLQEAQSMVPERVPNSGYTVINDVGDVDDLNILRLRKVSFAPVEADALRLVVTETWGQSYDKPKPRAHVFAFDAL